MPAKNPLSSFFSKAARTRKPAYILSTIALIGLAAWARGAWGATGSPVPTQTALTPVLTLAAGTLKLEGTDQAIDSASAAKLLPLWQLLSQLASSSAAAPQEISTVIDEIRLNMSPSQLEAINAMSFTQAQLGNAAASSVKASSTQAAGADGSSMAGLGMFAGGSPMDGGGPMPGGSRSNTARQSSASSASSANPSLIDQVIQLLEKKVQG